MAIQVRRGSAADFKGDLLLDGELAVCTDTDEMYFKGTEAVKLANNSDLETAVTEGKCLVVTIASFSSLPQTVSNDNITEDMVVVNSVLGTQIAQSGAWTVTTADGSLTVSGNMTGSTTLTLYLMKSR